MGAATDQLPPIRGLRPDPSLALTPLPRRQASLETNLCRKGVWHVGPLQLALPIDGSDTLGLLRIAGPPLTLFDLDTFAWLTERWREGNRDPKGRVDFTLYALGQDLYGRDIGGEQRSDVRASLHRLYEADSQLEGYRASAAMTGRLEHPAERGRVRLLSGLHWSEEAPSEQHRAYIGPFIVEQLEAGYLTYLDWRILRALEGKATMGLSGIPDLQALSHRRGCGRTAARPADAPGPRRHHQARAACPPTARPCG